MENQLEVIKNNQIIIGWEQELRKKDQEIKQRDQEIILMSTEAHIKTTNELLSLLKKVIEK